MDGKRHTRFRAPHIHRPHQRLPAVRLARTRKNMPLPLLGSIHFSVRQSASNVSNSTLSPESIVTAAGSSGDNAPCSASRVGFSRNTAIQVPPYRLKRARNASSLSLVGSPSLSPATVTCIAPMALPRRTESINAILQGARSGRRLRSHLPRPRYPPPVPTDIPAPYAVPPLYRHTRPVRPF